MSQPPDQPPSYEWSIAHPAVEATAPPALPAQGHETPRRTSFQVVADNESQEERQELVYWFAAVDEDGNGHITADELRMALINEDNKPFSRETSKMLVQMFDDNANDEIEFDEFVQLHKYVRKWREIFLSFDEDASGTIELEELQDGLKQLYSPHTFGTNFCKRIIRRFGNHAKPDSLTLDNFIAANASISRHAERHNGVGASEPMESFLARSIFN